MREHEEAVVISVDGGVKTHPFETALCYSLATLTKTFRHLPDSRRVIISW